MHISDFIYNINNFIVITYDYVTKVNWIITYKKGKKKKKKKKEVAIIRMYIAPQISNLNIFDQLNSTVWIEIDLKLIKGEHTLFANLYNSTPTEHV